MASNRTLWHTRQTIINKGARRPCYSEFHSGSIVRKSTSPCFGALIPRYSQVFWKSLQPVDLPDTGREKHWLHPSRYRWRKWRTAQGKCQVDQAAPRMSSLMRLYNSAENWHVFSFQICQYMPVYACRSDIFFEWILPCDLSGQVGWNKPLIDSTTGKFLQTNRWSWWTMNKYDHVWLYDHSCLFST